MSEKVQKSKNAPETENEYKRLKIKLLLITGFLFAS